MKKINTLLLLFLCPLLLMSQYRELFTIEGKYQPVGIDNQGNSYLLRDNVIYKFDQTGVLLNNFSDFTRGTVSYVDVSNPLKIIVLWSEPGIVAVLDNTLSPIGNPLDLLQFGYAEPLLVCASEGDGLWVYEGSTGTLNLISSSGSLMLQSLDLRKLSRNVFVPSEMCLWSNHILLYSETGEVMVLDNAASVVTHSILGGKVVSGGEYGFSVLKETGVQVFDLIQLRDLRVGAPFEGVKRYSMNLPYFLAMYETKISLYLLSAQ